MQIFIIYLAPEGRYKNLVHVYKELTNKNGIKSLYRGLIPVLIRTIPSNGVIIFLKLHCTMLLEHRVEHKNSFSFSILYSNFNLFYS